MSASGPRFNIPFPTNYLALNTRPSKLAGATTTSPEAESPPASHSFLSNRPSGPRHFSISSASSNDSMTDTPTSNVVDASPVVKQAVPTFLALNSKFAAPTPSTQPAEKTSFLSNRH